MQNCKVLEKELRVINFDLQVVVVGREKIQKRGDRREIYIQIDEQIDINIEIY